MGCVLVLLVGFRRWGKGVYIYVNNDWCAAADIIVTHSSPDIENLVLKCRPFFIPRAFHCLLITAVYIPPHANAKANANLALEKLHGTINNQLNAHPEGAGIVGADFNHTEAESGSIMHSNEIFLVLFFRVYYLVNSEKHKFRKSSRLLKSSVSWKQTCPTCSV